MSAEYEIWHSPLLCSADGSACDLSPRLTPAPPVLAALVPTKPPRDDRRPHLPPVTSRLCDIANQLKFRGSEFRSAPPFLLPFPFESVSQPAWAFWTLLRNVWMQRKKLLDWFCINWTLFITNREQKDHYFLWQVILLSKALCLCIFNFTCFNSDAFGAFPVDSDNN